MENCFLGGALLGGAAMAVALGHRQDIFSALIRCFASFYACHMGLKFYITLQNLGGHGAGGKHLAAVALHLGGTLFFGIKMILPRFARDNLPLAGNLKTLAERFIRFHTLLIVAFLHAPAHS
jgi:hypothetical protein